MMIKHCAVLATASEAYILHRRAYRETSFLLEIFSKDYGRQSLVAKGVRSERDNTSGLLQPFVPLTLSWRGKHELMSLTQVEARCAYTPLVGEGLFAGFYLNELLMYLLQKHDPHPILFLRYEEALQGLRRLPLDQSVLRRFEKGLLEELGYGLFPAPSLLHHEFTDDGYYRFIPEQGWVQCVGGAEGAAAGDNIFLGANLIAIAQENWQALGVLQEAKRLLRLAIYALLGGKKIHSRSLFG